MRLRRQRLWGCHARVSTVMDSGLRPVWAVWDESVRYQAVKCGTLSRAELSYEL